MSDLPQVEPTQRIKPIGNDLRDHIYTVLRPLQDIAQKRREVYRLAAHRWIATFPPDEPGKRPYHYLPPFPTPTQAEAHAYHVGFATWVGRDTNYPGTDFPPVVLEMLQAARAFLSAQ